MKTKIVVLSNLAVLLALTGLAYVAWGASVSTNLTVTVASVGGPAAEWTLTQGSVSGTTVADASGNGNTSAVVNGPLTFGALGANFNGTQYLDSALTITSPAMTVSVWFDAASFVGGVNPRLAANSHTDGDNKGFQLALNGDGATGFFDVGNGTSRAEASWSHSIVPGNWYHYVGVYDGTSVSAYLNGVQVATAAFAGGAIAAGTGPHINVARNPAYAGDFFNGAIYDARIYRRALSASEIMTLYQAVTLPTSFTSMTMSNQTFTSGSAGVLGNAHSTVSSGVNAPSWSVQTSGFDHANVQCNNYSYFSVSGTSSLAPSGPALTTADGTWTWGGPTSGRPGDYDQLLNSTVTGSANVMEVAGGRMYVNTTSVGWYVYTSGIGYDATTDPGGIVSVNSSAPVQSYPGVCLRVTQPGLASYSQAFTLAGTQAGQGPQPPAQATVAGFDTCVVCMDFTAASGGVIVNGAALSGVNSAQTNTWLDCAGASSPIWFHGSNGANTGALPCPDIVGDGLGNPRVLRQWNGPLADTNINGMKLWGDNGAGGILAPTDNYMEATFIVPQFPNKGYIQGNWVGGLGEVPNNVHNFLEFDAYEINTNLNPGAFASGAASWWTSCLSCVQQLFVNWFQSFPPNNDSFNVTTQYLTIGQRITSDSNTFYKCMWINNVFQNCGHYTVDEVYLHAWQLTDATSRMQTYLALTGCLTSAGGCGTTSNMVGYVKSFNMWSCSSWQTAACRSGSADPGGY